MNYLLITALVLASYLLGSLPWAVWTGKIFHGIDIREHGSGNAGATNIIRVLGWKTGVPVLLADVAKGFAATMLPVFFGLSAGNPSGLVNLQILMGMVAITGHIFPVFAGFRGGKGVATLFGMLLAVNPALTAICIGVFLIVILLTGIVSIASMIAGICFPLVLFLFFDHPSYLFKGFSILIALALIATHRKNIRRLLAGEEKKLFNIKGKIKNADK